MRDKIFAYLKSQKAGATSSELVEQVLKIKGATPSICEKLIQTTIAGDRRFVVDERQHWKIIEKEGTPLSETEFVFLSLSIVDTVERPKAIAEISAQKLRNDKVIDRFHVFVNPGSLIPSTIHLPADLSQGIKTGISGEKAVGSLFNFFGEAVIVGYDIQSSLNQLNRSNENIENASLCLKYLTKKLIPDLLPKSLDDVSSFFKHKDAFSIFSFDLFS